MLPVTAVVIDDDVEAAADRLRPALALNIGGMGAETANYHLASFERLGFETVGRYGRFLRLLPAGASSP